MLLTRSHAVASGPKALLALACVSLLCGSASAQLRVVTWNISNYGGSAALTAPIQTATYGSFNGKSLRADVLCVQEVLSASALTTLRNALNTAPGSPGDWLAAPFIDGADTEGVMLYRSSKVSLLRTTTIAVGSTSSTNQPRNTYRYDVVPVGYSSAVPANVIALYNTHMKASDTATDQARRLVEAERIRANAEGVDTNGFNSRMPAGYQFIVLGDFNIQESSQAAYVELVGSQANNTGRVFDPIATPGSWNNNPNFARIHTQDPADQMDDRLDQILLSAGLLDLNGMDYIGGLSAPQVPIAWNLATAEDLNHSYRCWGNDGQSYNTTIRTTGNTMVGPTIAQALIDACSGSGHLPVYLDLRMPARITSQTVLDFGTVTQGRPAPSRTLTVTNSGDVALWTVNGLATLRYTLPALAGFTIPSGNYNEAPGGGSNSHTISMSTATLGPRSVSLVLTTSDPEQPTRTVTLQGTVVANVPPVARAGNDITVTDSDNSGFESVAVSGAASTDSDGTIVNYRWSLGPTTLATGSSPAANLTLPVGISTVTLTATDDLGGVGTDTIDITVLPPANQSPVASAGADQTLFINGDATTIGVVLDGAASTDPDGTIAAFDWTLGTTSIATGVSPTVALGLGQSTIVLTVTDNLGATDTDEVIITVGLGCEYDYNQDENVDLTDAQLMAQVAAGLLAAEPGWLTGDLNRDENADLSDAQLLAQYIAAGTCPL
jgi:endonuclease/exonuclease/phosphatase family metal-dependent hydrolase